MSSADQSEEKRRFTRVPFVTHISLSQADQIWEGTVVDISFNGILINCSKEITIGNDDSIDAEIHFETNSSLQLTLELVHHHGSFYGFSFKEIDSDSFTHLRHIIAHNFSDVSSCERELLSLFRYHS